MYITCKTSSAFGSLDPFVTSQILAVFGGFRLGLSSGSRVLFFMFFDSQIFSVKPGIVITGVSINFLYSVMKYNSCSKSVYM